MSALKFFLGPTGGIAYHAAALRFRKTLWLPFVKQVDIWLSEEWDPTGTNELIVFGPSAGWTLSAAFIERFKTIVCVEPDPIARALFARRFSRLENLEVVARDDLLPWFQKPGQSSAFAEFLAQRPRAAVLFANLLGQIPLLLDHDQRAPDRQESARQQFATALANRRWASYHDVLSSRSRMKQTEELPGLPADLDPARLAEKIFEPNAEVIDHETGWLKEAFPFAITAPSLALWHLRPDHHHLVGFSRSM